MGRVWDEVEESDARVGSGEGGGTGMGRGIGEGLRRVGSASPGGARKRMR